MTSDTFAKLVEGTSALQCAFLLTSPEGLEYSSYSRDRRDWDREEAIAHFADLVNCARRKTIYLHNTPDEFKLTLETPKTVIVAQLLTLEFGLVCLFDRSTPLGMIRLYMDSLVAKVSAELPQPIAVVPSEAGGEI